MTAPTTSRPGVHWVRGVCAHCRREAYLTLPLADGTRLCLHCVHRAVARAANRLAIETGDAAMVPAPAGGGAMLMCELCPPGPLPTGYVHLYTYGLTGDEYWLCDDCAARPF